MNLIPGGKNSDICGYFRELFSSTGVL